MPAKAQIPNPMIGKKIRKVIKTPVMMGVVRIWTRASKGPPVGIVELCLPDEGVAVDVEAAVEVADVELEEVEECLGKGRSCRFSTCGWVPVSIKRWREDGADMAERSR